ncbi:tryptophan synthase subunit alpha [Alkalihalophilus pseudofirmus]|nr:tryptophan synthase subunit alpha [Alkalihalophilus pseudofirmus]
MMASQKNLIDKVKNDHEAFLTGYFVAADPSVGDSIDIIKKAVAAGLDVIEIGIPSKDPFLEGDVIRRAHNRTRKHFNKIVQFIDFLIKLRHEIHVPIWIMGYSAEVVDSNLYIEIAQKNLASAFIIPDISKENLSKVRKELKQWNTEMIPVINNHMSEEDIVFASQDCSIIYCQMHAGKTGTDLKNLDTLPLFEKKIRKLSNATLMAGFGIKNANLVREIIACGFDGVVVGSEIVKTMEKEPTEKLIEFIHQLKQATK